MAFVFYSLAICRRLLWRVGMWWAVSPSKIWGVLSSSSPCNIKSLDCKPCSLESGGRFRLRAILASAHLCNWFGVQVYTNCSTACPPELKPRRFILTGTLWGLWIAGFAKYSPDLWGQLCQVSAVYCVSRRGFSPPESCMQRMCLRRQRRSRFVADQLLGNSVGAIESVTRTLIAISHS
jgi:hypothetical protein